MKQNQIHITRTELITIRYALMNLCRFANNDKEDKYFLMELFDKLGQIKNTTDYTINTIINL